MTKRIDAEIFPEVRVICPRCDCDFDAFFVDDEVNTCYSCGLPVYLECSVQAWVEVPDEEDTSTWTK